jgi:CBS-domain-containing membrane protein
MEPEAHKKIRVGDIMTRNFVHAKPETELMECANIMMKNHVGSVVLKEGDKLMGLVTEKDIVWALTKMGSNNLDKILARDIATKKVHTTRPEAQIIEALDKMNKNKIRRMPVISKNKLVGFVTLKDLVKFIPSLFSEGREFEKIKEYEDKIKRSESAKKGIFHESPCEECGNFDILTRIDNRLLCESCKDNM